MFSGEYRIFFRLEAFASLVNGCPESVSWKRFVRCSNFSAAVFHMLAVVVVVEAEPLEEHRHRRAVDDHRRRDDEARVHEDDLGDVAAVQRALRRTRVLIGEDQLVFLVQRGVLLDRLLLKTAFPDEDSYVSAYLVVGRPHMS